MAAGTPKPGSRRYLIDLLTRCRDGVVAPRDVFAESRALWLSRPWPKPGQRGYDAVAHEVLFLLADARDMGLRHEDIPALLELLRTPRWRSARAEQRFSAYLEAVDWAKREALQQDDTYYGPMSPNAEDERHEITLSDPDERRLHRGIRLAPESVWAEVRERLCAARPRDDEFLVDLIEDLMYRWADEYIDRLEEVADECQASHEPLASAHLGGVAATDAAERFWELQDRLQRQLGWHTTRRQE
jgi:hypothetical protein